ncbi:Syntaxin-related protein KNOLLE [Vitis vinifera]|uniref:Syntaxin-related protein KNOLLE n=1 Tax=Vitis vinifera TaxID=29760 RepID=A0A438HZZ6_VITVI|nr:Syntaxin-related protein KNOLLE [Vitis vinifera]
MTKLFTSYVDLKKEAMKDLEAGPEYDVQMTGTQMDWNLGEQVPEALKSLQNRINADIIGVLKKARAIKSQLEDMDCAHAANMRLSGYKEGTPVYRTRAAVTNGVRKKLKELMMDFQGPRQRMMIEYKETVGRQYFTVTGEYPDEEVIEKIYRMGMGVRSFWEDNTGAWERECVGDGGGDTGQAQCGKGDREELVGAAPSVSGHGDNGGSTGGADG